MQKHHLKTKRKDKQDAQEICHLCHAQLHMLFTNTQLRDSRLGLDTIEGILERPEFQKALVFIRKQPPGTFMKMREARGRKGR